MKEGAQVNLAAPLRIDLIEEGENSARPQHDAAF